MVYVLSSNGIPIMPTRRYGKVRHLLNSGLAKVVKRCPFTIQLLYDATSYMQPVSLGIDAGSKTVGVSVTTENNVLYESEVTLRNDIVELLSSRRELRAGRRNRKTRYRRPRFLNRTRSKHKGWLAPSVEQKINSHMQVTRHIIKMLPVIKITVEVAAFDTQLLKAVETGSDIPEGSDYQHGEQMSFWNTREYVLFRDGYKCRCCKGKSKDPVFEVHHIQSRKTGGNAPNNLVTLCKACHNGYHQGTVTLPDTIKRGNRYNDAVFMGIMRWRLYERMREAYGDLVHITYGYITKHTRIETGLPKAHHVDARCISGNPEAASDDTVYYQKKIRCHNRQIHKQKVSKGGIRKRNQAPYIVKGYRLFDKVLYKKQECFITGRRSSGYFTLKTLDGTKVHDSAKVTEITLVEPRRNYITERRSA